MLARTFRNFTILALVVVAVLVVVQVSRITSDISPDDSTGWSTLSKLDWPFGIGSGTATSNTPSAADDTKAPTSSSQTTPESTPAPVPSKVPIRIVDKVDPFGSSFDVPDVPFSDPAGPKPHQIALLTAGDGKGHSDKVAETTKMAIQNRKEYADYHGYVSSHIDMSKYNLGGAHAVWGKLPAIIETFQRYPDVEWVWWLDLDAIIMTPTQDLTSLILSEEGLKKHYKAGTHWVISPPVWTETPYANPDKLDFKNIDLIVAQDQNGLNAGSIFFRRSSFTELLLDIWRDSVFIEKQFQAREQDALLHLVLEHPTVRKHTALVKQHIINSYVNGDEEMHWQKGDLVVHLAGCWVRNKCDERWAEYWAMKELLPST